MRTKVNALVGLAGLALLGAVTVASSPATASLTVTPGPGTRPGPKATAGTPLVQNVTGNAVVLVKASEADESGVVSVYPCASSGATPPMLLKYGLGQTWSNLVRTGDGPAADFCFEPSGPAHLELSTVTPPPGSFVPAPTTSTVVFDGTVTVGTDTVVSNLPGLAADVTGVSLLVTLPEGGSLAPYGCATSVPTVATVVGGPGVQSAALSDLDPTAKTLCLRALGTTGDTVKVTVKLTGHYSPGAGATLNDFPYVVFTGDGPLAAPGLEPVTPTRLFDTRDNGGARRAAGSVYELDLSTTAPPDATAVVMNVTVADPTADGFVTVYPCDITRPTASNLNYTRGQVVPNLVTVALAASAKVCFYTHTPTHLLADLSGWYVLGLGTGYQAQAPVRLFDTRLRTGAAPVSAGGVYTVDLTDEVLPTAEAVTMNVTVTDPAADGFLTVYPCDAPRPLASNLNFVRNQTVPNLVTVKMSATKTVCFYAQQQLHLIADLAGSFEPSLDTGFYGLPPQRLVDTRLDTAGALGAGDELKLTVPLAKLDAALFNVTVTDTKGPGFITVYPCDQERPTVSNLNFVAGQTVPNLVAVQLDATGSACFFAFAGAHLIVDLAGVYSPDPYVDAVAALTADSIRQGAAPLTS